MRNRPGPTFVLDGLFPRKTPPSCLDWLWPVAGANSLLKIFIMYIIIIHLSPCIKQKPLKCEHGNKHGNGLPEKPTAHQAGRPYNRFIIIKQRIKKYVRWKKRRDKKTDMNMDSHKFSSNN